MLHGTVRTSRIAHVAAGHDMSASVQHWSSAVSEMILPSGSDDAAITTPHPRSCSSRQLDPARRPAEHPIVLADLYSIGKHLRAPRRVALYRCPLIDENSSAAHPLDASKGHPSHLRCTGHFVLAWALECWVSSHESLARRVVRSIHHRQPHHDLAGLAAHGFMGAYGVSLCPSRLEGLQCPEQGLARPTTSER